MQDNPFTKVAPGGPKLGHGASRDDKLADWLASCPKMDMASFVRACFGKGSLPAFPWAQADRPVTTQDIVSMLCALGLFEPASATRPGACDIVTIFDKIVFVPAATINATTGEVIPAEKELVKFCAPADKAQVVKFARVTPANLTASESGEAFSKVMQVMGFSENFCPPGEPSSGQDIGTFQTVEHVILCPEAGFDLHARNHDPFSPASFHVFVEAWGAC